MTDSVGQRIYNAVLLFEEPIQESVLFNLPEAMQSKVKWTQKAICITSKFSYFESFKKILTSLYRIHLAQGLSVPLERHIQSFVDRIQRPISGQRVIYSIGGEQVEFIGRNDMHQPYSESQTIQNLLKVLSSQTIVEVFLNLILERKVLLISSYKSLLTQATQAFLSFIFPFEWRHTLIPNLPVDFIDVLDSPMPYLIGIHREALNNVFLDSTTLENSIRVDLDANKIEQSEMPIYLQFKVPDRPLRMIQERLDWATAQILERPDPDIEQIDFAFSTTFVDPDEAEFSRVDNNSIRDAFLEFMQSMLQGYR